MRKRATLAKIDVTRYVLEMEHVLHTEQDPARCQDAMAVLLRWQFDEMLDDTSRAKARMLVREFEARQIQATRNTPKVRHMLRTRGFPP